MCRRLFFDGYPDKGKCRTSSAHSAIGFKFSIEYSSSRLQELPGHAAVRLAVLQQVPHDVLRRLSEQGGLSGWWRPYGGGIRVWLVGCERAAIPDQQMQDNWRFCNKCHTLFYDGYADKGRCPAGGGHFAQGYIFKLFYVNTAARPALSAADRHPTDHFGLLATVQGL